MSAAADAAHWRLHLDAIATRDNERSREQARVDREAVVKAAWLKARRRLSRDGELPEQVEQPPTWLKLTDADRVAARALLSHVFDLYPATCVEELVWCLAVHATRRGSRGNKPIWAGHEGHELVDAVEAVLRERGQGRGGRKAVLNAAAAIRSANPARYGGCSAERLRQAYYEALPRYAAIDGTQLRLGFRADRLRRAELNRRAARPLQSGIAAE